MTQPTDQPSPKPLRITFVCGASDLSGGARVISIYADYLHSRGHTVNLVSRPRRRFTLRDKLRAWVRGRPIPVNAATWPSHYDNLHGPVHRKIAGHRPVTADDVPDADVVIATWWETAEWVIKYPPAKGRKAYFIQHYEAFEGQDAARVDATWRLPMHKVIIAQWLVDMARDRFGDRDVSYVPNAVDPAQFHAPPRGKQPVPTVGTMYAVVPFKACQISLRAFELARERVPDLRLVTFGVCAPTHDLPLPAGTEHVVEPAQDRIRDVYAQCDAWLFASRSEGFGLPLLEAMACRTPVIATPTGAAPELVAGGGGVLVPMEDPRAMAVEIERVVNMDDAAWRRMSDAAHATAVRYTWTDAAAKFEAALARAR
jgi:glycosyltransferase involved in cell wall biosynthesis